MEGGEGNKARNKATQSAETTLGAVEMRDASSANGRNITARLEGKEDDDEKGSEYLVPRAFQRGTFRNTSERSSFGKARRTRYY